MTQQRNLGCKDNTSACSNDFDKTEMISISLETVQDTKRLCDVCWVIRKDYDSYHHKPENLIESAEVGCPCCRLIVNEVGDRKLTTNRPSQIILGTKSDIIYKIYENSGRWSDDFYLRFEFFRQRGRLPSSVHKMHILSISEW